MSESQIEDLARPFVSMIDTIKNYYTNPANEQAFQEWYKRTYGKEHQHEYQYDS